MHASRELGLRRLREGLAGAEGLVAWLAFANNKACNEVNASGQAALSHQSLLDSLNPQH
jgi:hypothetical protein